MAEQRRPILRLKEIADLHIRRNFEALVSYFRDEQQLYGFRQIDAEVTEAVSSYKVAHGLGYTPLDVIPTRLTGAGALTWNYADFTDQYVVFTTTGACRVRAFVGTYRSGA